MARMRQWIGLAAVSLTLAGCVPQEKYAALKLDDDQLRQQLGQAQTETEQAKAQAAAYQQQLAALNGNSGTNAALVDNLNKQNQNLQSELDELNRKYADAIAMAGKAGGTALPAPLSNELSSFAAANPDLVDFDAARGIVKFKSDVTFEVGDATVNSRAKEVLSRFASILNSSGAGGYELLVAGHTDSTPVANPETIRKGHKNNWYLSAHRAIAVVAELASDGVNPRRLGAVGYAEQRPIASNLTESGKAANRRVEVLILPSSVRSAPVAENTAIYRHARTAAAVQPPTLNKDSASVDTHSAVNMNK
jgi:chemotaxis protein MotB